MVVTDPSDMQNKCYMSQKFFFSDPRGAMTDFPRQKLKEGNVFLWKFLLTYQITQSPLNTCDLAMVPLHDKKSF